MTGEIKETGETGLPEGIKKLRSNTRGDEISIFDGHIAAIKAFVDVKDEEPSK